VPDKESRENAATPKADIQAILDVIGRRSEYHRIDKEVEYGTIDLNNTDLEGANLQKADLSGANLWKANLQEVYLYKANLQRSDLREVHGLTQELIELTIGSYETRLPEDLNRPELWSKRFEEQVEVIEAYLGGD
jgi:uncharacterized protein YjbI with pentapeptide repeats